MPRHSREVVEEQVVEEQGQTTTPTQREILTFAQESMNTHKQIINLNQQIIKDNREVIAINKRILDDMKETTRLLGTTLRIRTCPNRHNLTLYTSTGGNCDVCERIVWEGEQVMDCRQCNWYMCTRCARNNGFTIPRANRTFQSMFNEIFNSSLTQPRPTTVSSQSELYRFDIPLNGRGFDDFITQLTQTLNEIAPEDVRVTPTESQISAACVVMPANEANLSDQYVCPIDLSPIDGNESVMKIKHCGHVFRERNLRELFTRDVKCPMCRFDIREHVEDY